MSAAMEQLYQQVILDHSRNPVGKGLQEPVNGAHAEVSHFNPTCGDQIVLRAEVHDGVVTGVSHEPEGCSISVAAASVMTENVVGLRVEDALMRYDAFAQMLRTRTGETADEDLIGDGVAFSGVAKFPARVKCALLAWAAMKEAVVQAAAADTEPTAEEARS